MPAVIACPKCQTKYKLPDSMLGKPIKCKSCGTGFKTPAPQTAQAAQSSPARRQAKSRQPSSAELAQYGLDGPLQKQADLFAGAAPARKDILGNHAADPGFASVTFDHEEEEDDAPEGFGDIIHNPYAREVAKAAPKKKNYGEGDSGYQYSRLKVWAVLTSIGVGIEAFLWIAVPAWFYFVVGNMGPGDGPIDEEEAVGGIMAILAALLVPFIIWMANSLFTAISFFVYIFKANCNVRALGAKGLKISPSMSIIYWFIPFMNSYKPYQSMIEICKASERPRGKAWKKLPEPKKLTLGWLLYGLAFLPALIMMFCGVENGYAWASALIFGVIVHAIGAVILIMQIFDTANRQQEIAIEKYGEA